MQIETFVRDNNGYIVPDWKAITDWVESHDDVQHDCKEHSDIVKRVLSDGRVSYYKQCLICGKGKATKSRDLYSNGNMPTWDDQISKTYTDRRRQLRDELHKKVIEFIQSKNDSESRDWWKWYNEYLQTPQWKRISAMVIARANGICEGCGVNPARHAHHLTYEHVGNEPLFELVAVCSECHQRLHPDKDLS